MEAADASFNKRRKVAKIAVGQYFVILKIINKTAGAGLTHEIGELICM